MPTSFVPCWSSNNPESHALEESEEYIRKGNNLLNWKIPKFPISKIYKTKPFTFFFDKSIKTKEEQISCGNGGHAINLISEDLLFNGFFGYRYNAMLNVGMIQIGVKTMTAKIPSNSSIILCVYDTRKFDKFEDSILGLVESKLSDGPLYFNVFPNITMSMSEGSDLWESLSLFVIVKGFEQLPFGTKPISLTLRNCYKLQTSDLPDALIESPQGKSVFFQTDVKNSKVAVQKVSKWDEVICKVRDEILKK